MLGVVMPYLICPICGFSLGLVERSVQCDHGHVFDVARQGYVNLLADRSRPGAGDTADMITAREAFLGAGHFTPLAELLLTRLPGTGLVVDVGAGPGYYLRAAVQRADRIGLAIDLSRYAVRRAARVHPRIGAVLADVWQALPVRTGAAVAILNVFAPRNGAEFRRMLRDDGVLLVGTPTARHLAELVSGLGLLAVDLRKDERLTASLRDWFRPDGRETLDIELRLDRAEIDMLVRMGPSAWHLDPADLRRRVALLPDLRPLTVSVDVTLWQPI